MNADELKKKILNLTAYFRAVHRKDKKSFSLGETRIPYAGRVFDEKEMVDLVDASLEFWLTYGRYSSMFEIRLAEFLGLRHALLTHQVMSYSSCKKARWCNLQVITQPIGVSADAPDKEATPWRREYHRVRNWSKPFLRR